MKPPVTSDARSEEIRHEDQSRPARLVGVIGTGTEVGKTWVTARLIAHLKSCGLRVAVRKPVQSYGADATMTDAQQLADASGETPTRVCPAHRCYPVAMAPPMAADALNAARIQLDDLVDEITWPPGIDVAFVETVGGVRSPLAHDGDSITLLHRLNVDELLLVADAGLGTLNSVRLTVAAVSGLPLTVLLNRFDGRDPIHASNHEWLRNRDGLRVVVSVEEWQPMG